MRKQLKWLGFLAIALLVVAVAGCQTIISALSTSSRNWQFIQAVGGIAVGQPVRERDRVRLPIRCDVSGTETITVHPTAMSQNSGLVCKPPRVRIRDGRIFVTIRTGLPDSRYPNASCPDADLGAIAAGDYPVIYLSPDGSEHPIAAIQVPPK